MRGAIVNFLGQTSHQLDEAQPESLESDGDKAYGHERRVAPVMMFCSRHSDVAGVSAGFCRLPLPTACERLQLGEAPAKMWSFFFSTSPS